MIKLLLTLLVLAPLLYPEGPVVVPVAADDITEIRKTHDALVTAQKKWDDLQQTIGKKYLVVAPTSPDASDQKWWDEGDPATAIGNGNGIVTGITTVSTDGFNWVRVGNTVVETCETDTEKVARVLKESKEKAEQEKFEADRKKYEEAREAKSKRIRKGFDGTDDFIFSGDYKYLLKKPPPPPEDSSHQGLICNSSSSGVVDSNVTTEDVQSNSSGFAIKGNN